MGSRALGFHVLSGRRWRSWSQLGSRYSRECDLAHHGQGTKTEGTHEHTHVSQQLLS